MAPEYRGLSDTSRAQYRIIIQQLLDANYPVPVNLFWHLLEVANVKNLVEFPHYQGKNFRHVAFVVRFSGFMKTLFEKNQGPVHRHLAEAAFFQLLFRRLVWYIPTAEENPNGMDPTEFSLDMLWKSFDGVGHPHN
jgi:hypothetical protein